MIAANTNKIVMSETSTYDLKVWDAVPGKERVYMTTSGKQLGFYDMNADCLCGEITTYKPEWKAKLLTDLRAAFAQSSETEQAEATLTSTYYRYPCNEEQDDLSRDTVGVFLTRDGKVFEKTIQFAAH